MARPKRATLPAPHNSALTGIEAMAERMAKAVAAYWPDIRSWHPVDALSAMAADARLKPADRIAAARALLPLVTVATKPADLQVNIANQVKVVYAEDDE